MPAVINEAFRSPFDNLSGLGGKDTDTADIRNTNHNPNVQNLDFSGLSGGSQQPYPTNYNVQQPHLPSEGITWGTSTHGMDPNQLYASQTQTRATEWQHSQRNCDQLIGEIMKCRVCRDKLRKLLNAWEEDHQEEVASRPRNSHVNNEQEGGSGSGSGSGVGVGVPFPLNEISPTLISNIIVGIAILFLLDRILKLRLVT